MVLIGWDECFPKDIYGGQLLITINKDVNNQMLPFAFTMIKLILKTPDIIC